VPNSASSISVSIVPVKSLFGVVTYHETLIYTSADGSYYISVEPTTSRAKGDRFIFRTVRQENKSVQFFCFEGKVR
jgi:hypothetical protein